MCDSNLVVLGSGDSRGVAGRWRGLWVYNFVACGDQQLWIHRPAIPLPTLMVLGSFFFFFLINSLSLSFFMCQVGNKKRTCLLKLW